MVGEIIHDAVTRIDAYRKPMPELPGSDLLHPRQLLEREVQLVHELAAREQRLQADLAARVFGPVDAVFDLLEESGAMLERQAESLQAAARALEESAGLMKAQAELFEKAVATVRQPTELAKSAAGGKRRKPTRKHR